MNKQPLQFKKSLEETTSTSFYAPRPQLSSNFKQATFTFSNGKNNQFTDSLMFCQIRSIFPQICQVIVQLGQKTQFLLVEEQLSLIKKILRKCQTNLESKAQFAQLNQLIAKYLIIFKQTKQRYNVMMAETKQNIEVLLFQKLQKLLRQYKKQWERIRNKCQSQLKQDIENIKTLKQANQQFSVSMLKKTGLKLKEQTNQFTQELKTFKKNINGRNNTLFEKLQNVRNNLNQALAEEEQKRSEYDQIIYTLLDKTCQNAAHSLRRRVF